MVCLNCCFPVARIPAARTASPAIDPSSGNVHLDLTVPSAGPFVARPRLAYNSQAAHATIQFGYGWADVFNPTVSLLSTTVARVVKDGCRAPVYTDKDGSGQFLAPSGVENALQQNGDPGAPGFTETQPDDQKWVYDSSHPSWNPVRWY
jgi:hypothetical protein